VVLFRENLVGKEIRSKITKGSWFAPRVASGQWKSGIKFLIRVEREKGGRMPQGIGQKTLPGNEISPNERINLVRLQCLTPYPNWSVNIYNKKALVFSKN